MLKGKQSEVGENKPTEKSQLELDNLVGDVTSPLFGGPKSTLPKEEKDLSDAETDEGLEDETQSEEEPAAEEEPTEAEETEETEESEGSEDEPEEDVIPVSKHKKILEKMNRRIDKLVSERESARIKEQSTATTQEQKLGQLSGQELDSLVENTTEAIEDAAADLRDVRRYEPEKVKDFEKRLSELRDLRRNAKQAMKEAPVRFQRTQLEHFNQMVDEVKEVDPQVVDRKGELYSIAQRVYARTPSLHRSETGQAEALAIATEVFLETKSLSDGRERNVSLSKKVANLKRKTALDSKTRAGNQSKASQRNLREKAVNGTYYDKLAYIQKTLVPDDFLQP